MLLVDALGGEEAIAIAAALFLVIGLVGVPSGVPCFVGVLGEEGVAMLASTFDFFSYNSIHTVSTEYAKHLEIIKLTKIITLEEA